MPAVQPLGLHGADKELGAVGVGARVSHGQDTGAGVTQLQKCPNVNFGSKLNL